MILKLKLHSVIDLITNSSTEIFACADEDSAKTIKEFINAILKQAGSDKTSDDLFTVRPYVLDENENPDYENIDYGSYETIVYLEIKSITDDTDLSDLISNVFELREMEN